MDTVKEDRESDPLWVPDGYCIQKESFVCVKEEVSFLLLLLLRLPLKLTVL